MTRLAAFRPSSSSVPPGMRKRSSWRLTPPSRNPQNHHHRQPLPTHSRKSHFLSFDKQLYWSVVPFRFSAAYRRLFCPGSRAAQGKCERKRLWKARRISRSSSFSASLLAILAVAVIAVVMENSEQTASRLTFLGWSLAFMFVPSIVGAVAGSMASAASCSGDDLPGLSVLRAPRAGCRHEQNHRLPFHCAAGQPRDQPDSPARARRWKSFWRRQPGRVRQRGLTATAPLTAQADPIRAFAWRRLCFRTMQFYRTCVRVWRRKAPITPVAEIRPPGAPSRYRHESA